MTYFIYSLHRFKKDCDGAIAIMFAVLLPVLIGFLALATDAGVWFVDQRKMQSATDLAAITAAKEIGNVDYYVLEEIVKDEAARNGYDEADGITFTVNNPPTSGSFNGDSNAIEVILSKPQDRFFSILHTESEPIAVSRAVAFKATSGEACVLALDPSASGAITFQGNPDVELDGCIIASNSSDSCAVTIGGSASLEADGLRMVGDYCENGNPTLDLDESAISGAGAISDPYADLSDPSYGGCDKNNYKAKNTQTLTEGVYCNGLTINANADITLEPGTYYITNGDLRINGGAEVLGEGVTIVMTGSGSNVGSITINGSAELDLSAPIDGSGEPYEGILIYQDRDAPAGTNRINGGSTNNLVGTIYTPSQAVEFSGNSSNASSCLRLVAKTVKFGGNSGMSHNCAGVGGDDVTTEDSITLAE